MVPDWQGSRRDQQLLLLTGPEGDLALGWLPDGAEAQRERGR
jgi:hypothetical protein